MDLLGYWALLNGGGDEDSGMWNVRELGVADDAMLKFVRAIWYSVPDDQVKPRERIRVLLRNKQKR